jgi:LacI family repressor for deo operon, udp, cdd, tsx, nupC, and nupG
VSSIHDVAKAAGVSTATVSRALRGLDRVSPQTRARVIVAAEELRYVASPTAASLVSGKTHVVGVVVPFLTRWFFANLMDGAEQLLRRNGYHIQLFNVGSRGAARTLILDRRLLWKRLDAVLVLSADLESAEVELLRNLCLPVVTVGVDLTGCDRVGIDDVAAAEVATSHLVGLGHRRIAYVGGNPGEDVHMATAVHRLTGVRRALGRGNAPEEPSYFIESDWTMRGGVTAASRLLDLDQPPTAVVAASDEMAVGVLYEARRRGCDVPGELSVIGIDDHEMSFAHNLTTVAQPVWDQGRIAGELLLNALSSEGPHPRRVVTLPTALVVRGSTGPPAATAPALHRLGGRART